MDAEEPDFNPFYHGITLLKFGKRGAPKERTIYLSKNPANRYLTWRSGKFKLYGKSEIDLQNTIEGDSLRVGQTTVQFARQDKMFGESSIAKNSLSLMYVKNGEVRSLNVSAPNHRVFKYVHTVLLYITERAQFLKKTLSIERLFLKQKFEDADSDRSGLVSKNEVFKMIPSLNIQMSKFDIKQLFAEVDEDHSGQLDFIEFCKFLEILRRRVDLEAIWTIAVSGNSAKAGRLDLPGGGITPAKAVHDTIQEQAFLDFWNQTQKERLTSKEMKHMILQASKGEVVTVAEVEDAMQDDTPTYVTYDIFRAIATSRRNECYNPSAMDNVEDLNAPISDYFINSSHNTYLEGDQLWSQSSVSRYIRDLSMGIRCVELDCWDGDKDGPIIYHGHTATGKIKFKDVIKAIKQVSFINSDYPVILSIENHCSYDQQGIMAMIMLKYLGDMIQRPATAMNNNTMASPIQLQKKILIKGKRPDVPSSASSKKLGDGDDESAIDDFGQDGVKMSRAKAKKAPIKDSGLKAQDTHGGKIHPDLAAITFLAGHKI